MTLERPLPIAQIRKFKPELVAQVDRLLDRHCDREIADILNERGLRSWEGKPFNLKKIAFIRAAYNPAQSAAATARSWPAHHAGSGRTLRYRRDHRASMGASGPHHQSLQR
ncbi:hypothetical protein NKH36_13930 [Mesorhizobium sp. M1312]|uniref:hypothetical protein n=1 Tax=unclassified Mesorhizobium TaxID=325217 RepID=UPI00333946D8